MFRSVWCRVGGTLKRAVVVNGGEPSSSISSSATATATRYILLTVQNPIKARVPTPIFSSFSTSTGGGGNVTRFDYDPWFEVAYLIDSCGLTQDQAIAASEKLNFKTSTKPDSVLALLRNYGFTDSHISQVISKYPSILSSNPEKTLKPKLDFFKSRGLHDKTDDLANFISRLPTLLDRGLNTQLIPNFDLLRSIVQSDKDVITMIERNLWILSTCNLNRVMVNVELLRNEGVPETNISKFIIQQPRVFTENPNRFTEIVEKVKDMGFNHLQTSFLKAIQGLTSMTEANWRKKKDVYKRWGWSEDQILKAFRKNPDCMKASEEKIMAVMNFLVNEMGYDSLNVAENPIVFNVSLKKRIIPRCSVIKTLVSKSLIKDMISINALSKLVDESFLEKFVMKHEKEVPELMQVLKGQLNYQKLLQN